MKRRFQVLVAAFLFSYVFLGSANSQAVPDPTQPGLLATTTAVYDFGDTASTISGFPGPVEFRGSVVYPIDLSGAPHPLLVFLHGRHSVCFQGSAAGDFTWPCPAGQEPIPSFQGYQYLATNLASHGYIVVSISADGINAADNGTADLGALARAQLIQEHLNLWNTFNTTGGAPFGTLFVGKVDMTRVGTMGHSRGGEGVVRHFTYNQSLGSPFGIKAVFAMAPTDFNHEVINGVPLAVMLPYCDGDVVTLEGVHFYDDSRYNVPGDPSSKHSVLVMGANHDYFNTIWTPSIFPAASGDDWHLPSDAFCGTVTGNGRLTPAQQESVGLAYVAAFLRTFVGGETQFLPLLTGAAPAPPSASPAKIHVSFQAADSPASRLERNTFLTTSSLDFNALGAAIKKTGMSPYSVCGAAGETTPCVSGLSLGQQPHNDSFEGTGQLSQLITGWSPTSTYTYTIPAGLGKAQAYQALQFRAAINFADVRNAAGVNQDFSVVFTDGAGKTASVPVSAAAPGSLFFPPGTNTGTSPVPRNILNTVRIPISAFSGFGLNLNDIRSIQFKFNQTGSGGILITDLAFTSGTAIAQANYVGFVDSANCSSISGWAADKNRLNTSINAELYDGTSLIAIVAARLSRPDVATFLGDNGLHGFSIPTPDSLKTGGVHSLHVKFETSATEVSGSPASINCAAATPSYVGFVDVANCTTIAGWAADRNRLNSPITVEIYDGNTLLLTVPAGLNRPDVGAFLGDNGDHGFSITLPASLRTGTAHSVHVKFETSVTDLSGSPDSLTCP